MNRKKPPRTKLICAAQRGQIDEVRLFLSHGADVNARDGRKSNETAIHESCYHNDVEMTRLLLKHGADPNVRNDWGNAPLHHAIWLCGDRIWTIALPLEAGADSNVPMCTTDPRNGLFPLHVACRDGWFKVARLLLEHGAEACARDKNGCTPLDLLLNIPSGDSREQLLDLFRQYAPEQVMEAYCTIGPGGM